MTARLWPTAVCADGYRPTYRDTFVHVRAYFSDLAAGVGHIRPSTVSARWTLDDSGPVGPGTDDPDGDTFGLDRPYREVTATAWMTPAELADFRREWDLEPEHAEPALGFLGDIGDGLPRLYPDERHTADGDGWNVGGVTPILWADISIIGPGARPA